MCLCVSLCVAHSGQKRASDLLELELLGYCQLPNIGAGGENLKEQCVFLTTKLSLQALSIYLFLNLCPCEHFLGGLSSGLKGGSGQLSGRKEPLYLAVKAQEIQGTQ